MTVTDTLRDSLAATGDDRLNDVAQVWAQTEEFRLAHLDAVQLAEALRLLTTPARRAVESDGRPYCWWGL